MNIGAVEKSIYFLGTREPTSHSKISRQLKVFDSPVAIATSGHGSPGCFSFPKPAFSWTGGEKSSPYAFRLTMGVERSHRFSAFTRHLVLGSKAKAVIWVDPETVSR